MDPTDFILATFLNSAENVKIYYQYKIHDLLKIILLHSYYFHHLPHGCERMVKTPELLLWP